MRATDDTVTPEGMALVRAKGALAIAERAQSSAKGMNMKIEIREYVEQRPNGDRGARLHPSSRFEVVLVSGDQKEVVLSIFDQFDSFDTHINDRPSVLSAAKNYAHNVALVLDCEIGTKRLVKKVVSVETWVEDQ